MTANENDSPENREWNPPMGFDDFQKLCLRTESKPDMSLVSRLVQLEPHLLERLGGLFFLMQNRQFDDLKKAIFYGRLKRPLLGVPDLDMEAVATLPTDTNNADEAIQYIRVAHGVLGLVTELEEVLANFLEYQEYREFNKANLIEELGDLLWYISIIANAIGTDFSTVVETNVRKLLDKQQGRYKSGAFSSDEAHNRDTDAEQKVMHKELKTPSGFPELSPALPWTQNNVAAYKFDEPSNLVDGKHVSGGGYPEVQPPPKKPDHPETGFVQFVGG